MLRKERLKLPLLMTLHLMWGVVLWFSISKYGLGVSTDAVHLLFGAENLAAGNGLRSYDGTFIALWPPLYPAMMAAVRLITGLDILVAAAIVHALAFVGMGLALSVLFLRIFRAQVLPAAAALLLVQAGEVVVSAAGTVGSDYVHLFLVVTAILLTANYVETEARAAFIGLAIVTTLAPMQRYVGIAATATAIAAIIWLGRAPWRMRLLDALVLGLTTLPGLVWLALTSPLYSRRPPITFTENFTWFSRSMLEWFIGPTDREAPLLPETLFLWTALIALVVTALILARNEHRSSEPGAEAGRSTPQAWPYIRVLLLHAVMYAVVLFSAASISFFNKLGGRFILPLYLPLTLLPLIVADGLVQAARRSQRLILGRAIIAAGALAALALGLAAMRTTYPFIVESRAHGVASGDNSFNTRGWHENSAIRYWNRHLPAGAYLLLSNEPDGVAFHTRHAVRPAPRTVTGPYGTDIMPVADFEDELFGPGLDVYLIWIESSSSDYYYSPEKLAEIAAVETVFSNRMGSVYRLTRKALQ